MQTAAASESVIRNRSGCEIHRYARLILAFSWLLILANSLTGQDKLIDGQVISKWKAYEVFSRKLQGMARKTKTFDSGKVVRSQSMFKQNKECVLGCITAEQLPLDRCLIANPRYAVRLNRSKTDPTQVALDEFTNDPNGIFGSYAQSLFAWTFSQTSPHFVVGRPLHEFVANPENEILKVSKEMNNGLDFVRIDYRYKTDPNNRKYIGPFSNGQGWFILDPSRCWCVVQSKSSARVFSNKGEPIADRELDTQFEFSDHPSGFPLVKSVTSHVAHHNLTNNKKQNYRTVTEYEWEVNDRVPDSEFTLSAFGLPEPGSDTVQKPTPLYLWILLGAAACALLAVGFRYLARRRNRDVAAT